MNIVIFEDGSFSANLNDKELLDIITSNTNYVVLDCEIKWENANFPIKRLFGKYSMTTREVQNNWKKLLRKTRGK